MTSPSTEGKLREALALANSMILSGEQHSEASRKMIADALSTTSQPVGGNYQMTDVEALWTRIAGVIMDGNALQKDPDACRVECLSIIAGALNAKAAEKAVVQEELDKAKKFISKLFYETLGGWYALKMENAMEAIEGMVTGYIERNEVLTTSNKGLLDVMEKIAREKIIKDHCAATGSAVYMQKIAQQALEQFGGRR